MGSTHIELVQDLRMKQTRHDLTDIQRKAIKVMIFAAKDGLYHDFATSLATPKMSLVEDLRSLGFEDLAQKVINGDYDDESPDDEL